MERLTLMGKSKLLKCPFCGGTNIIVTNCRELEECKNFEECEDDNPYFAIVCNIRKGGCGASSGYYEHEEEAIEAWNRRAKDD